MAAVSALKCERVVKRFGPVLAVDHVDLQVAQGEIFALLGPNGAGKSTLIHCITGLALQTEGSISIFGHDTVRDFRTTRSMIGFVPQEISFDPFFTPFESLKIHMGLMGVRPDPAWADELLARLSLASHRNAYTRQLSGGMKRRLLIAKALVHHPKLLFLDEPTAGVDVELRKDLWRTVRQLREDGTTVILTTHYLEEAEQLADRIAVIHHGKIVLVEKRDVLMRRHGSNFAELILENALTTLPPGLPEGTRMVSPTQLWIPLASPDVLRRALEALRSATTIRDLKVARTSLEDIFVNVIRRAEENS